jgi:predicted Zn-dependent protease with MMP-like domain
MASRRALIDSGRERTHLGDLIGHLLAHEMAAETDLAPLPDEDFTGIRQPEMVRVESIT